MNFNFIDQSKSFIDFRRYWVGLCLNDKEVYEIYTLIAITAPAFYLSYITDN